MTKRKSSKPKRAKKVKPPIPKESPSIAKQLRREQPWYRG